VASGVDMNSERGDQQSKIAEQGKIGKSPTLSTFFT